LILDVHDNLDEVQAAAAEIVDQVGVTTWRVFRPSAIFASLQSSSGERSFNSMKILAFLVGLVGGVYGLFVSLIGGALIAVLAGAGLSPTAVTIATILVYGVPLLSIAGAVLVFAKPAIATALFVVSGLAWLALSFSVTASPESSVDPKSMIIPLVIANGLAALFAWLAARKAITPKSASNR
jgi:hypothetical protein